MFVYVYVYVYILLNDISEIFLKILQVTVEHQLWPYHDTPQTYSFPQALPIQNKREKKEKERGEERREEGKEGRKEREGRGRVRR